MIDPAALEIYAPDCSNPHRILLAGYCAETEEARLFRPRCGLWGCPECARLMRSQWALRAAAGVGEYGEGAGLGRFVVLTHWGWMGRDQALARWGPAWARLSARLRREAGADLEYFYVHEHHQSLRLHTHILAYPSTISEHWWHENAPACGFGRVVYAENIRSNLHAAAYVARRIPVPAATAGEMAKQLGNFIFPPHWRRVGCSRAWPRLPDLDFEDGWEWRVIRDEAAAPAALAALGADVGQLL